MSIQSPEGMEEIPCNTVKNITHDDGTVKSYRVRTFGVNGVIMEKYLIPITTPDKSITVRTFDDKGIEVVK